MGFLQDLRFAGRALLKRPGFTAVVLLTLALGIGATTAVFSVVDTLLLRPVPLPGVDRLVQVLAVNEPLGIRGAGLARGDFRDFRAASRSFAGLAAYTQRDFDLTGGERPRVVTGAVVSPGFFSVLGVEPAEGRGFARREEEPGQGRVVVLGHSLRMEHFGAGPALGRTLELDGEPYRVVGVLPPDFHFPGRDARLWVPLSLEGADEDRMSHYLGVIGRLPPDVSAEGAGEELAALAATLERRHPDSNADWSARVVSLVEHRTLRYRTALLVLSGAVLLLLLIACANVANLLLARAASRQEEAAVRAALGSSRSRLVRVFLVESLVLALLGGVLGLLLARGALQLLVAYGPAHLPRLAEVDLDGTALLFTFGVTLLAGLLFGAVPALQLSRTDVHRLIRVGHGTGGRTAGRLRGGLVVAEVALALVLVIGASLMLKGFLELSRVDPGFEPQGVLALHVVLSPARYPEVPPQVRLFEGLVEDAEALPGVVSAAAGSAVPLSAAGQNLIAFTPEERAADGTDEPVFAEFSAVTPGFFRTLRIPRLAGRDFRTGDAAEAALVVIVNQHLARRFWPGGDPVGKRLLGSVWGSEPSSFEVVGVVGDVRQRALEDEAGPAVYVPYRQVPHLAMTVVVRSAGDPVQHAAPLAGRLQERDPDQPVAQVTTLARLAREAGGRNRFYTGLLTLFGGVGLLLAAVGIYGVIAYTFARRSRELAIRVALGAAPGSIRRLVLGEGLKLAGLGVALGLAGAFVLARLLSSLLYGVEARDPWIFVAAPVALLAVAVLASYLPARRAVRVAPRTPLQQGG